MLNLRCLLAVLCLTGYRRGARPIDAAQVEISRAFQSKAYTLHQHGSSRQEDSTQHNSLNNDDVQQLQLALSASKQLPAFPPNAVHMQHRDSGASQAPPQQQTATTAAIGLAAVNTPDAVAAIAKLPVGQSLVSVSEVQQLSALVGLASPGPAHQQNLQQQRGDRGDLAASSVANAEHRDYEHFRRMNAKLDAFGEGLVDRLMALEDAGNYTSSRGRGER